MDTHTFAMKKTTMRQRFVIICFFLLLSIGATVVAANATIHAVQDVHNHQVMEHQGDVHLIRQWMTIPYIAHVYRIPASILYAALKIKDTPANRHSTLETLALQHKQSTDSLIRKIQQSILDKQSTDSLIRKIQQSILDYRKDHPFVPYPTPTVDRGGSKII
ncbi:hypothetical protein KDA_15300 [Dictyobacter alpinus]|uniref:Uncharacterized protein n=1 Tax=Dictyobacter alpinus TaxID=2014873 RepID=A0A402B3X7_9CHLR|nr:hypothetical protein [Dictyobacter alpinus]GCE26046.1 hypothetical protein KDA_15300 [Dictyobacter alpinus]